METASLGVGRRPYRGKKMTEEYKEYTLKLLYADSKRLLKRLGNQRSLFDDLLQTNNMELVDRELRTLDTMYNEFISVYAEIQEIAERENTDFQQLAIAVDQEDTAVFKTKKDVSLWMIEKAGEMVETSSHSSRGSKRSRDRKSVVSRRSRRSASVRSNRSDSVESERSAKSVQSVRSNVSRTSRASQRAKVAGLKAEVEVLQKEGVAEIKEQVEAMKVATEKFEEEQKSALSREIHEKKRQIEIEEEDDGERGLFKGDDPFKLEENHHAMLPGGGLEKVISQIQHTVKDLKQTNTRKKSNRSRRRKSKSKRDENTSDSKANIEGIPGDCLASLSQSMMKMMKTQSAPNVEIDVFSGDNLASGLLIATNRSPGFFQNEFPA